VAGLNVTTLEGAGRWVNRVDCGVNPGDAGGWARLLPRGFDIPIYAGSASPVPSTITDRNIQVWVNDALAWVPARGYGY
jgi:hypothetical protein